MSIARLLVFTLGFVGTAVMAAGYPELQPDHPSFYEVEENDTLWDVSQRFLREPWRWRQIARTDSGSDDPAALFPGDTISLAQEAGRPVVRIHRARPLIKLSPRVREEPLQRAIPTIPVQAVQQFLMQPRVVDKGELANAPYVVAQSERRLISAAGDKIYVRGYIDAGVERYGIYRAGDPYRDYSPKGPNKGAVLGYQAIHVGDALLDQADDDPATLVITGANLEVLLGDRLMPIEEKEMAVHFIPHEPEFPVEGYIVSIEDGPATHAARLQTVVVSVGEDAGLAPGDVLEILASGDVVRDPFARKNIHLPPEHAGLVMLYRVFAQVSFGLIMESRREIGLYAKVRDP